MFGKFTATALLSALVSGATPKFNDATYLAKKGADKQAQIMTEVLKNTKPQPWYNTVQLAGLFTESMDPTMHTVGDEMPGGTLYGTRSKLIHTEGVIATVQLKSTGKHPFTGLFAGADYGVFRMSAAAKPDIKVKNLTPGIGLKFLRDGKDSASLVAMYSVDG